MNYAEINISIPGTALDRAAKLACEIQVERYMDEDAILRLIFLTGLDSLENVLGSKATEAPHCAGNQCDQKSECAHHHATGTPAALWARINPDGRCPHFEGVA